MAKALIATGTAIFTARWLMATGNQRERNRPLGISGGPDNQHDIIN